MLGCDANNTDWGYQIALRWKRHSDGHYCAFTDRQHKVARQAHERFTSRRNG